MLINKDNENDIIKLNVGGTIFTTSRKTLCSVKNSFLDAMFNGTWKGNIDKDKDGNPFLDINPDIFSILLDAIRMSYISKNKYLNFDFSNLEINKRKTLNKYTNYLCLRNIFEPSEKDINNHYKWKSNDNNVIFSEDFKTAKKLDKYYGRIKVFCEIIHSTISKIRLKYICTWTPGEKLFYGVAICSCHRDSSEGIGPELNSTVGCSNEKDGSIIDFVIDKMLDKFEIRVDGLKGQSYIKPSQLEPPLFICCWLASNHDEVSFVDYK